MVAPIRLDFAASTTQARTEINALSATLDNLQRKMLQATGVQTSNVGSLGTVNEQLHQASATLGNLGSRKVDLSQPIKETEKLVDGINRGKISWDEYRRAAGASSRVVAQQLALQRAEINNIRVENGKQVADFNYGNVPANISALERLAMQAKVTGAAGRALGQEWIDVGKNMAFSARQLTISLTAPFMVVSALSMKAYMDTAEALTDIAKVYGDSADGFTKSAEQIKAEARDLAKTMSEVYAASYEDTYAHQKFYAQQGLTGADLTGSVTQATRLQMLGDVDTVEAQQAITTLTNVYGVQTEKMGQYVDYMNKIEDSTTLTMQDFSAALPKIGPIIRSFEEDPKEATKAMAEMLEAGKRGGIQSATEIANAWKSIYTKVARPTEQLKDVWQELGGKNGLTESFMGIVNKNGGDVLSIIKEISSLTADWSDVDKNRLFSQLAGAQQVARMTTFAQQLANSNETIKEINKDFDNNPDTLAENSKRQQDMIIESAEKKWAQFTHRLRDLGITIGQSVFPPIMQLLEGATTVAEKMVSAFQAIPGPLQTIMKIMGGFAVVLGPAIGVIGALIQVSGQFFKIWNTGRSAIGGVMGRMAGVTGSKKLMTVSDAIRERTSNPNFEHEMMRATLEQEKAARDAGTASLNRLSTAAGKAAAMLGTMPSALERAAGPGLTEEARVKREARLSPAEAPRQRSVYVPPRPEPPKVQTGQAYSDYAVQLKRHVRAQQLAKEAEVENRAALDQYNKHEAYRKRVEARYQSYTNYVQNSDPALLQDRYEQFRKETAPRRLQNSDFMRGLQSQLDSGVLGKSGGGILQRQKVADQLAYVNRDISTLSNKKGLQSLSSPKWLGLEKQIQASKAEQARLNNVLKGSTSDIAKEAVKIEQAQTKTTSKGLQYVRSIVPTMRRQNNDFLRDFDDTERTGLTKSGMYQASDRGTRRTVRKALKADPKAFDNYLTSESAYARTNIPMDAKGAASEYMHMTPEIQKMVTAEKGRQEKSSTNLLRMQEKINDRSADWAASLAQSTAIAGSLMLMFAGDNEIVQGLGVAATTAGMVFSMMPETAGKAMKKIASVMAPGFNTVLTAAKDAFSGAGEGIGAGLVGGLQGKFMGFTSWLKGNAMAIAGWSAGLAAAAALGYAGYQMLTKGSREYQKSLEANIARGKELSEVLGYTYVEPMPARGQTGGISQEIKDTAQSLKEVEGMTDVIDKLRGKNMKITSDLNAMRLALRPEAIKILASGGTEADVNKMIKAALYEAGANEATIEDFKLNLKVDDADVLAPTSSMESLKEDILRRRGGLEGFTHGLKQFPGMLWADLTGNDDNLSRMNSETAFTSTHKEQAASIVTSIKEAMTVATDEAKPEVLRNYMSLFEIPPGASDITIQRLEGVQRDVIDGLAQTNPDFNHDWAKDALAVSDTTLSTMLGGKFNGAEDGAAAYADALKELQDAGINLSDSQRMTVANLFRTASGLEEVAYVAGMSREEIDKFSGKVAEVPAPPKTLRQMLTDLNKVGQGTKAGVDRVLALNHALKDVPGSFSRRWDFYIDINNVDDMAEKLKGVLKEGSDRSIAWGHEFAAKEMEKQHQNAVDGIREAGDRSLKALEGQQKAAEKAMKAQEKALEGKHRAQTKALDNRVKEEQKQFDKGQKEEKKVFDKQQREEKKAFDKRQQAEKKTFDKDIERQQKEFNDKWKAQEDSVKNFYDASRKYIEGQQAAEDKLDKARERNAEAERKRQEMLNDLANKNVDINVAIAGGNLDEAAKLMNDANAAAQTYYAESGQDMSDAQSEDRSAARQVRLSGLSEQENIANDVLALLREQETATFEEGLEGQREGFSDRQSLESEAFSDKQSAASETFEEKLDRKKEEFQAELDARKEQLQMQQEQEREFLNAQREAEQEYFNNKRAEIQSVTDATIKGAEDAHEARKEAMAREIELLKIGSAQNEEEVKRASNRILGIYDKYGVDLGHVGEKLQGGMIENFHTGMDLASEKIRQDEKWTAVGQSIGELINKGLERGMEFTSRQVLQMMLEGAMPDDIEARYDAETFRRAANGPQRGGGPGHRAGVAGRATGGPIFGPGTATSDSIPAMLSNGEHVLTAAEVAAFGGHAAVEKWRKDILSGSVAKFAVGGAVGGSVGAISGTAGLTITLDASANGGVPDGGVISGVTEEVENLGKVFDESMSGTIAPAWQLFGDQLIKVNADSVTPVFDSMSAAMARVQAETTNSTAGIMAPAWFTFGQNLVEYKNTAWDMVMDSMQAGLKSVSTATTTAIVDEMMPAWQAGANHIQNMQNSIIDPTMRATREATDQTARNFETAADMIGTGWAKVKENTANPVRFTIDTVFNKGLVGMWNNVAEALDLETFKEHPLTFATGGVLPGYTPGRDVHKFTSPTGGALHLSGGEAIMRPEWTRAVGGPSAVAQMNSDAKNGKVQKYADGGVVHAPGVGDAKGKDKDKKADKAPATPYGMPAGSNIGQGAPGFPAWVYNIGAQFGLRASTYAGHQQNNVAYPGYMPNPLGQNRGIDWWGTVDALDTFARYLVANGPTMPQLEQVIWDNPMTGAKIGWYGNHPANGDSPIYSNDWIDHRNHVHTRQSQSLDGTGSMDGIVLGSAGGGMLSALAMQLISEWNTKRGELEDKVKAWTDESKTGIAKDIPGAVFKQLADGMYTTFSASLPTQSVGGSNVPIDWSGLPADIKSNIELGKFAAEKAGWTGPEWEALKTLWHNESGWDNNAQNPTSTAYGIAQFLDSTWAGFGPKTSDPKKQIEYGIQYIKSRPDYGGPVNGTPSRALAMWQSRSPHWYDEGGLAYGKGAMMKNVVEPERVLSPQQTKSFDSLVDILDRSFGRRSNVVESEPISEIDYMNKITQLDKSRPSAMSEKEYNPKSQEEITKSLQPIFNAFQSFIQQQVVPGVIKYTTELIQMKTDEERLKKVSGDIIAGIEGLHIPTQNEVNMVFGGTVYGDGHLVQIMEDYKRQILSEVRAISEDAARRLGGK